MLLQSGRRVVSRRSEAGVRCKAEESAEGLPAALQGEPRLTDCSGACSLKWVNESAG